MLVFFKLLYAIFNEMTFKNINYGTMHFTAGLPTQSEKNPLKTPDFSLKIP
jgi:hypothetical protein